MGKSSKILKSDLRRAIKADGGNVSRMAARFGVSRQTIYNRLDETGLRDAVQNARRHIYDMAVDNVVSWLDAGDPVMSRWVLERYPGGGPDQPRWTSKQEVVVGQVPISDETLRLLETMGVGVEDVAAQFEALVREAAEVDGDG